MFYVGQKVVCVDDKNITDFPHPIAGHVYTVRSCTRESHFGAQDSHGVQLRELPDRSTWSSGYGCYRFRPLTERKTDISIFKRMLTPKRESIDA